MSKKIESKLDQFHEQLVTLESEGKTLLEMQKWLHEEGVAVAQSTISRFLESARSSAAQERILQLVVSGAQHCAEVDRAFSKNPAPELETLIKLFKVLIMKLTTQGAADLEQLRMADQLSRTAIEFISGQTKANFKRIELEQAERKLKIAEEKARQADAARQVTESKLTPSEKEAEYRRIFGMS